MTQKDPEILDRLDAKFPGSLTRLESPDQPTVLVPREVLWSLLEQIKIAEGYALCLDVAGVDYFPAHPRFEVVYHLYHPTKFARIRVKVKVGEGESVPSVVNLWHGADWPEREAYDLFGILFEGHPNLTRIYMPDDWEGHPLRKDYPTTGTRVD